MVRETTGAGDKFESTLAGVHVIEYSVHDELMKNVHIEGVRMLSENAWEYGWFILLQLR